MKRDEKDSSKTSNTVSGGKHIMLDMNRSDASKDINILTLRPFTF